VIKYWTKLLRQVVESPFLEIFNTQLDNSLDNLTVADPVWAGVWTRWSPDVPANLCNSAMWICDQNVFQNRLHSKL